MSFPPEIRIQALVAAARYCCVCHRYKGVKVEVHHIVPQAQGGSDNPDNAMALCFDCHADAGHYNPKHPRGTRFSPQELRAHRDAWHRAVQEHRIKSPNGQDFFYCRYLVCRNFEAFREISQGDFRNIPFANSMLVQNDVLRFHQKLIQEHPHNYRHAQEWGDTYPTIKQFWEAHPESERISDTPANYPYFQAARLPTEIEIRDRVCPSDGVTRFLVGNGVPASEIAKVLAYKEECAGEHVQEIYRLRPLWTVYFAVTYVSDELVTLSAIEGVLEPTENYRPFKRTDATGSKSLPMPRAPVRPDATVIIPLATLLGPFEHFDYPQWSTDSKEVTTGQVQELIHTSFDQASSRIYAIGPAIWPTRILFVRMGLDQPQEVHDLDLTNLYLLNRYWEAGCCPYLFFRDSRTGAVLYVQELFSIEAGIQNSHSIQMPPTADEILIAELEHEETYITEIREDGLVVARDKGLRTGQVFSLGVRPGALLQIKGCYVPDERAVVRVLNPWRKNELIARFIYEVSSQQEAFSI